MCLSKYKWDDLKSRVAFSQKIYHQMETGLQDFMEYVPLHVGHLDVHSFKLITILLETGPEVINSFDIAVFHKYVTEIFDPQISATRDNLLKKENARRKKNQSLSFADYYNFLNAYGIPKLSRVSIRLKNIEAYIVPFETIHPEWWETYNLLKHDKYNNFERATFRQTLRACAGLFALVKSNSEHVSIDFASSLFNETELSTGDLAALMKI